MSEEKLPNDILWHCYELMRDKCGQAIAITCLRCGLTSYNLNDVVNRYCGNCHLFHAEGR
jgi:ribosomal protein L37E